MRYFIRILLAIILPLTAFGARTFSTSTDTLVTGAVTSLPLSGTVSLAVFPSNSQDDGIYHYYFEAFPGSGVNGLMIRKTAANTLCFLITNSAATNYNVCAAADTFSLPTSQWTVLTVNWTNGGDMFILLNGIIVASSSVSGVPALSWTGTGTQVWSIGNADVGTVDSHANIGLVGLWNRVLTEQECIGLSLRFSPHLVAPSGLLGDWDLTGGALTDSAGGHTLTASGTTTGADPTHINLGTGTSITNHGEFH